MSVLKNRIASLIEVLSTGLVEREDHIKLMLLAALAGEHVLLIGPPGTAKSLLARRLRLAFREAKFFERLLTQFSVPEDLFGPYSLEDLDKGRYRRLTEGYLADADVGFLDEIFKANPSILNALLTLLNERVFHNVPAMDDDVTSSSDAPLPLPVPLKCLVGASNEVPEPGGLDALYDRFLIRCEVGPVEDFQKLLRSGNEDEPGIDSNFTFTNEELENIRRSAKRVVVPQQVDELLGILRYRMAELQLDVSDRRWLKIRKLLQVAAYTSGREQVSPLDVLLVPHCVWSPRPENQIETASPSEKKLADDQSRKETPLQVRNGLTTWLLTRIWSAGPNGGIRHLDIDVEAWHEKLERCTGKLLSDAQLSSLCQQARECGTRIDSLRQNLSDFATSDESQYVWFERGVVRSALDKLDTEIDTCAHLCDRMHNNIDSFEALRASHDERKENIETTVSDTIDFSLPGNWSCLDENGVDWESLSCPEEGCISVQAHIRYRFRFKPPATEVNLVRLMRDYGSSPNLVGISLGGTYSPNSQVSDLTELRACKSLDWLDLSRSRVKDLKPLEELSALQEINADYTPVEDLSPLSSLPHLERLSLRETRVSDISALVGIRTLTRLTLEGVTTLTNITPFRQTPWLREVDLSRVPVDDWDSLCHLTQLETLRLNKVEMNSLHSLRHLRELRQLFMTDVTTLESISGIENLERTQELVFPNTKIQDLAPLSQLRGLRKLVLTNTLIDTLSPLQGLSQLEHLDLEGTPVTNIAPLVHLTNLRILNLKNTQGISNADIESLKDALPMCDVQR